MPYKKPNNPSLNSKSAPASAQPVQPSNSRYPSRPNLDPSAAKQAAQFPGVGVTLGSYKHNPFRDAKGLPTPKPKRQPGRVRQLFTIKRTALTILVLALLVGGWVGGKFIYNAHRLFHGNLLSILTTTKLKGEDNGRINILLAGNSADDKGHDGAALTDSIMIISIDTKNNQAFLLSVPRDLYVQVPGTSSHSKINYVYVAGELEKVVGQNFGLTINYYALVNYTALRDAVNAVGGIDLTIQSSDPRGLYDPSVQDGTVRSPLVKLTNGPHHLNGVEALNLARARGDSYRSYGFISSDFQRTKEQRDILLALKTKAVTAGVLGNPAKLSSLADAIGGNVKTDFSLSEVHRLYDLMKPISSDSIKSYSLNSVNGKNLLASYTTSDGQSSLIPASGVDNYDSIQKFITQVTSSDPVVQEGAGIVLLNATTTPGLASQQRTKLENKNYTISDVGNATPQATTTIIQTKAGVDPKTLAALLHQFGAKATATVTNPFAANYPSADFIVLLGADQVPVPAAATPPTRAAN
jgi:LCP family protein required for cell wall assembly